MAEDVHYMLTWGMPGGWEWLVILVVALLIFGRRLPELARSLGKSLSEFKRGVREAKETKEELEQDAKEIKDEVVNEAKDAAGLNELGKDD